MAMHKVVLRSVRHDVAALAANRMGLMVEDGGNDDHYM